MKRTYKIVDALCNNSSWSWDNKKGTDITPKKKSVWDDYILAYPSAAPFCNSGWVYLAIFDLFRNKDAKGTHVFCALQEVSAPVAIARESSPPWPETLRDSDDTQIDCADVAGSDSEEDNDNEVCFHVLFVFFLHLLT